MKELIIFYIGFTMGLCFMDYLDVKDNIHIHLYRRSIFHITLSMLLAPLTFPFYLIIAVKNKIEGMYL